MVLTDTVVIGGLLAGTLLDALVLRSWLVLAEGTAATAVLLWRRRRPTAVFATVATLTAVRVLALIAAPGAPTLILAHDLAGLVAMYSVVKFAPRLRDGWLAGAVMVAGSLVVAVRTVGGAGAIVAGALLSTIVAAVWLFGLSERNRWLFVAGLQERAVTAERERDQRARLAVARERASIARELHDIVAHSLSVMIVQADGARYALDRDPDLARAALETVAGTGREALDEMRRLVAVLRGTGGGGGTGGGDAAVDRPRAGLDQLTTLAERARVAGLEVTVDVVGEQPRMPAGVELALYRIVQEAVTNAIKHAGAGTAVQLRMTYRPDAVEVRVRDDGAGRGDGRVEPSGLPGGGNGLVGLRERVAVYEGTFSAGAQLDGGWLVQARVPLPAPPSRSAVRLPVSGQGVRQ